MKIIGEKINGTRKRVAQAIAERDGEFIEKLATAQVEAGSTWLDVNAGTHPDQEPDDLAWLITQIQSVVDIPLCLDSANPKALETAMELVKHTPMINSISGEPARLKTILPLVAEHGCRVIALAMDEKKVPKTSDQRLDILRRLMAETRAANIPDDHVYCDPLAMTIATDNNSAQVALETMRVIKQEYPEAHLTIGLSNISFGLPARKQVNQGFLIVAMQAGLDTAILDPLDRNIQAAILIAELLLGRDRHCLKFIRASRAGMFE